MGPIRSCSVHGHRHTGTGAKAEQQRLILHNLPVSGTAKTDPPGSPSQWHTSGNQAFEKPPEAETKWLCPGLGWASVAPLLPFISHPSLSSAQGTSARVCTSAEMKFWMRFSCTKYRVLDLLRHSQPHRAFCRCCCSPLWVTAPNVWAVASPQTCWLLPLLTVLNNIHCFSATPACPLPGVSFSFVFSVFKKQPASRVSVSRSLFW